MRSQKTFRCILARHWEAAEQLQSQYIKILENKGAVSYTHLTAKVTWSEATDNVGVVGYNVYLNEAKVNETLITTTEYDLTALTEETNYSVKVTAVDAAENESGRSEAATFTTPKTQDTEMCIRDSHWSSSSMRDPDGLRNMTAAQVLEKLIGPQ